MDLFRRLFSRSSTKEPTPAAPAPAKVEKPKPAETEPLGTDTVPVAPLPPPAPIDFKVLDGVTRPLPAEKVTTSKNEHLVFGQSTDIGMVRSNNQDSALSFFFTSSSAEERPDFGLFIVADGMGGHHDGEKASAITTRVIASQVANNIYLPILAEGDDVERPPITEALVQAVQKANSQVITSVPDGGTTATAVAVIGDLAYIAHVGDTRVYLIHKENIEQITRDHSLVQRLIELEQLSQDEAADHPQKNVLYRALGQNESLEVDTLTRRLPPGARVLLCSDGLWSFVKEKEIFEIVSNSSNPQEACDKLISLANTRGGFDNITAILLRVPSS
ncbi:MAG: serine/threonine-protein phosphatase [Chloroflexi bacterium]|nr:serine/threonine-protein phosphatase [Chloroflexota bacterium]